ncbi:unnamed protein product, partial [Ixodes pacificus]
LPLRRLLPGVQPEEERHLRLQLRSGLRQGPPTERLLRGTGGQGVPAGCERERTAAPGPVQGSPPGRPGPAGEPGPFQPHPRGRPLLQPLPDGSVLGQPARRRHIPAHRGSPAEEEGGRRRGGRPQQTAEGDGRRRRAADGQPDGAPRPGRGLGRPTGVLGRRRDAHPLRGVPRRQVKADADLPAPGPAKRPGRRPPLEVPVLDGDRLPSPGGTGPPGRLRPPDPGGRPGGLAHGGGGGPRGGSHLLGRPQGRPRGDRRPGRPQEARRPGLPPRGEPLPGGRVRGQPVREHVPQQRHPAGEQVWPGRGGPPGQGPAQGHRRARRPAEQAEPRQ